ncbi:MAG: hypothetical protein VYB61_03545 [Verrucomicrobiota bacterium]|nr:hypothetical protein [Verrucomicrobiota bacterium]
MRALKRLAGQLLPRSPREVASPEQELRFTRSRQAMTFLTAGIAALCLAGVVLLMANPVVGNQADNMYSPWWALLALAPAALCFWVVVHCTRHAFIILTPLGIELFPFWFPARNMQVIYWSEIKEAGVSGDLGTFTIKCRGRQVMATLAPIPARGRILLKRAIEGRMKRQPDDPALNN